MPSSSILDIIAIREVEPNVFESLQPPERMGNTAPIAYGGCAMATACMAAHAGVPSNHRIYSMTGNFLGPAGLHAPLTARVRIVRSTRTFTTKEVTISQAHPSGGERNCLITLVDFHAIEPATFLTYSKPPGHPFKDPTSLKTNQQRVEEMVAAKTIHPKVAELYLNAFDLGLRSWDHRTDPDGINTHRLEGFAKHLDSPQLQRPLHERFSQDYFRSRVRVEGAAANAAALAFMMDGAIAFQPLIQSGLALNDAGATSTLDFALRFFVNDVDVNEFVARELKCISAGIGRSYNEAQLWDLKGNMVASMTQSGIIRPLPAKGKL